jgi:2-polyprenyl-3-methyl-5-hydroxy-6-metoxy-1,4-benzoquinol methylase
MGLRRLIHRQRFLGGPLGNGYDVAVCGRCGAGFADRIPTQAKLDHYYAEQSKYEYAQSGGAESPYDFRRFELIVEQVLPFLQASNAAILDIGCATGGLLSCLKRRGYTNLLGSDPSPTCVEAARRLHQVEVIPATIAGLAKVEHRFDLILLVGVLEHLCEVRNAVDDCVKMMKPGGLLYCAQPDVQSFQACNNAPYQQFSTEHLNFFSRHSLNTLMRLCGLKRRASWRWLVEWREGISDSVVSAIYEKPTKVMRRSQTIRDKITGPSLDKYVNTSRRADVKINLSIEYLISEQIPIFVWGVGTLTHRLLAMTRFSKANILAFVDSNPHTHGTRLANRPVLKPEQLAKRNEPIFICSTAFGREIATAIRKQYGLQNQIISLPR